jgi:two-component system, chemotaxis family, CheB/CheR fusion protein
MSTLPPSQFLANHIRDAYRHTEVLSQTIKTVPEQQSQFLMDCLEELHVCLEEMEVAQEELCQQHEEVCLAQQQIEIERQRYRSLFEFAPDGYLVTDRWGTIREANQAATNLFKIRRDRIIGKPLATWVSEEYRRAFRTILNELPQLKRVQEWEIKLCDRELGVFDVAITVAFDRCVGTAGGSFRWLIRDISQRKQAENQLQQTQLENLQLLETDRLRRQFMATLTHELRTPMNAILGFSDLLLRKWNHQGCLQEINLLERVQRNGRHLLHLIEDMLDFSKLEANRMPLHLQEIDLGQVIALVVEELRPLAAKKQLELRSQIQPEPLTQILSRCKTIPAQHPQDGQSLATGHIYIAPPDHHLLFTDHQIHLSRGPRENGHRPAIDAMFRSAALRYGNRVIGVVLSGMLDDGTVGLEMIKSRGGFTIAQDPQEALFTSMPERAIQHTQIDAVLPLSAIATCITQLCQWVPETPAMHNKNDAEKVAQSKAALEQGKPAEPIAIAFAELLGIDSLQSRVKIYATDVDEEALTQARQATYTERELAGLSPAKIEQYFDRAEDRYVCCKDLRRSVIFGRHDLIQDAPISKLDLLICRNTLMYFNAETQTRILTRFHFALRDTGFLFLGKAEMLLTHANAFTPVDLRSRVFTKVPKLNLRDRLLAISPSSDSLSNVSHQVRLREASFDAGACAQIVIDLNGLLTLINEQARLLLNLSATDLGRPLQDLEVSYRPVELRSCIEQVYRTQQLVIVCEVEYQTPQGKTIFLDVQISPLLNIGKNAKAIMLGININFIDVTRYKQVQQELEHSNQELEMAYEELQSTNEELETTNEELQSSNEELETTNEELQSTNEELETTNEELQSTNEELQTVNDELQQRSEEINHNNAFLESILTSLRGGVVVVDRNLNVQAWSSKAEELWGLRTDEALEQNFLNLDIGLPVEQLRQPIRECLLGSEVQVSENLLQTVNRRGRPMLCRVTCTPLLDPQCEVQGVILLMEEQNSEGDDRTP